MSTVDPFDILRDHLRGRVDASPMTPVDELVRGIVSGEIVAPDLRRRSSRRARRGLGFGLVVIVVAGGTLAAAALLRGETVTKPDQGVLCRGAADVHAGASQIPIESDPVAACRRLWAAGDIPTSPVSGAADGTPAVPELVACVGVSGNVEVYPIPDPPGCAEVGLEPLGTAPLMEDPIIMLQEQVIQFINAGCVPPAEAPAMLEEMLAGVGLEGWQIVTRDGDLPCSRIAIDGEAHVLYVVPGPVPVGTQPLTSTP